jgi:hypothetical protein
MSPDITVHLSDSVRQRAEGWAEQTGMPLSDFLAETIELSLLPLGAASPPVNSWSDEEVLQASNDFFSPEDDQRLSDLLVQQREEALHTSDRDELHRLMTDYQERLARKALAMAEAVRRGLREPVAS